MGTLYLVATPIGNLEDISYRALRVLREVAAIAAEDTRTTRKLLSHYQIGKPLISFHEYSRQGRLDGLLARLEHEDLALVSEAGMPAISDPGYALVARAVERGIQVIPIPGACALIAALAASGLPTDRFAFEGFPPHRAGPRQKALAAIAGETRTLIFYEAPHRLLATLRDLLAIFGDRHIVLARELTKLYEEFWRGDISEAIQHFEDVPPRGEFTLVVAGATQGSLADAWSEAQVQRALYERHAGGLNRRAAAKEVALLSGWGARDIYRLGLQGHSPETSRSDGDD